MAKIYFWLHGGLGDVIWAYLQSPQWLSFQAIRDKNPAARIKAIVISYNRQSAELIRFNPYINEIDYHLPNGEQKKGMRMCDIVAQYAEDFLPYTSTQMHGRNRRQKIYLTDEEKGIVEKIKTAGPYIAVHPFASIDKRQPLPIEGYIPLMDKIIDSSNIVLLGGTHTRAFGGSGDKTLARNETLKYGHKGVFNLIGRTNSRVSTSLVLGATEFVGTWSCYSTACWTMGIKATVITHTSQLEGCNRLHSGKYKAHHPADRILPFNPNTDSYDKIIEEIL